MDEISVKIKFNREISDQDAEGFVALLDEELGHTLNKDAQRWEPKNFKQGWGMGTSLVSDVELVKE